MPWSQLWALTLVSSTQLHEPPHRSPLLGSPSCLTPFLISCQWPPWNIHYNFILCFWYSAFLCLLGFPCRICARGWNPRALGYRHTFVFSVSKVMWEPGGQNERYQVHKEGAGTEGGRCGVGGGVVGGRAFRFSVKKEHSENSLPCSLFQIPAKYVYYGFYWGAEHSFQNSFEILTSLEVGDNLFPLMEILSAQTAKSSLLGQRKM